MRSSYAYRFRVYLQIGKGNTAITAQRTDIQNGLPVNDELADESLTPDILNSGKAFCRKIAELINRHDLSLAFPGFTFGSRIWLIGKMSFALCLV